MFRSALFVLAACSHAPAPQTAAPVGNHATTAVMITPPSGHGRAISGRTVVVDTGEALYLVANVGGASPVHVPAGAPAMELFELAAGPADGRQIRDGDYASNASVLYVAPATLRSKRTSEVVLELLRRGHCLVPVVENRGQLVASGPERCKFDDEGRVHLTVYVTPTDYWVGLSRVNEFQRIPRTGPERGRDTLATSLKTNKVTAFFYEREDAEVTADDNVTYGELVDVATTMVDVGFKSPMFVPKFDAAAVPDRQ